MTLIENARPKVIPTRYKGYHFRSRLEARWAVTLDAAGVRWVYEPEGFDLPSGRYLPDFWLPEINTYLEVKPYTIDLLIGPKGINHELAGQDVVKAKQLLRELGEETKAYTSFGLSFEEEHPIWSVWTKDWGGYDGFKPDRWRLSPFECLHFDEAVGWGTTGNHCPICRANKGIHHEVNNPEILSQLRENGLICSNVVDVISFTSEMCSHKWAMLFEFHKGSSAVRFMVKLIPGAPIQKVLKKDHIAAGRSARFEHGQNGQT